ncbi:restriction endonuclease fold toxin-2 domain-containing protein [Streptomyces sp. NPDC057686]|uniref:restriction endonuclease fold toxin-2 domain-containing protein n=1 Tax=Streptomyces sp. NPDC057686 TaxID=3346212 RepID=UPI003675E125
MDGSRWQAQSLLPRLHPSRFRRDLQHAADVENDAGRDHTNSPSSSGPDRRARTARSCGRQRHSRLSLWGKVKRSSKLVTSLSQPADRLASASRCLQNRRRSAKPLTGRWRRNSLTNTVAEEFEANRGITNCLRPVIDSMYAGDESELLRHKEAMGSLANHEVHGVEIVTNGKDNAAFRQSMTAIPGTTGSTRYVP